LPALPSQAELATAAADVELGTRVLVYRAKRRPLLVPFTITATSPLLQRALPDVRAFTSGGALAIHRTVPVSWASAGGVDTFHSNALDPTLRGAVRASQAAIRDSVDSLLSENHRERIATTRAVAEERDALLNSGTVRVARAALEVRQERLKRQQQRAMDLSDRRRLGGAAVARRQAQAAQSAAGGAGTRLAPSASAASLSAGGLGSVGPTFNLTALSALALGVGSVIDVAAARGRAGGAPGASSSLADDASVSVRAGGGGGSGAPLGLASSASAPSFSSPGGGSSRGRGQRRPQEVLIHATHLPRPSPLLGPAGVAGGSAGGGVEAS
jgi:hypothetical protein